MAIDPIIVERVMIEVDSSGDEDVLGEEAENPDGMKCARSGLELYYT